MIKKIFPTAHEERIIKPKIELNVPSKSLIKLVTSEIRNNSQAKRGTKMK